MQSLSPAQCMHFVQHFSIINSGMNNISNTMHAYLVPWGTADEEYTGTERAPRNRRLNLALSEPSASDPRWVQIDD